MKRVGLLFLTVVACASGKEKADTTLASAPGTVKPAPAVAPDTVKPAPVASRRPPDLKSNAQPVSASKGSKVLGKDSVIRFDMGAPGRQLGRPDTTKKKPQ